MRVLYYGFVLVVLSKFAIILLKKRANWLIYFNCVVAVSVPCFFLTIPWVGLQSVIVIFPGHTHLYFK